jgi:transposase InsO family protein
MWARTHPLIGIDVVLSTVRRPDRRSAYRSDPFAQTSGKITLKRTRPYRPQTNGKVERFWGETARRAPLAVPRPGRCEYVWTCST